MKTLADVERELSLELNHFYNRKIRTGYLYYTESGPEHIGCFGIYQTQPSNPDYKLACPQAILSTTPHQENIRRLMEILRTLPILEAT